MAVHPFLERLRAGPLLADGAMGTMLYAAGVDDHNGFEGLNLTRRDLVQSIHRQYIAVGAEAIETNTFGGNRFRLAEHGQADRVRDVNFWGVKIAREAREVAGEPVFVLGAVGPTGIALLPGAEVSADAIRDAFREQVDALVEAGADALILETFTSLAELRLAYEGARACCDLPVIAQLTFTEEALTPAGDTPEEAASALDAWGAEVIGVNCSVGPQGVYEVVARMARVTARPLSALPNAGFPARVDGRFVYFSTPGYFADYARRFAAAGVALIGGCCGTTPEHIAAMRAALGGPRVGRARLGGVQVQPTPQPEPVEGAAAPTELARKLARRKFVVSVELDPPKGINPSKLLAGARMLRDVGVDCINIGDSPMARVRMSCLATAYLIQQQVGLETIIHFTSRDRNLMGLQSDLMGAHALGVRNVLALTGDPPSIGNYPGATGVWDVDSIGLVAVLKRMNQGEDWAGTSIGKSASFFVGCAVNPNAEDLKTELERFRRKLDAGADFVMTQPLYDIPTLERFLQVAGPIPVPMLLGVMPVQSYKHAEFLHHEVPGIAIPDFVRERMRLAGDQGMHEGVELAQEFLAEAQRYVQGVYLMPSFGRYEMVAELVKVLSQPVRR
ncbi:MAG: bifunctional homocysteine S-methyltransferase/methylenetetrahydrofolate reductase [Chloroflexi bacterium]|nr:bifunctional homocysteine S-methyltransferase/methylenetetrahydrofolate reductase [Chloroflexota bacterium]